MVMGHDGVVLELGCFNQCSCLGGRNDCCGQERTSASWWPTLKKTSDAVMQFYDKNSSIVLKTYQLLNTRTSVPYHRGKFGLSVHSIGCHRQDSHDPHTDMTLHQTWLEHEALTGSHTRNDNWCWDHRMSYIFVPSNHAHANNSESSCTMRTKMTWCTTICLPKKSL